MMQTIFLKEEECYCPLDKFYANVAKHLGYDVPYDDEKHKFDCRKICITPSVYQKIKECYKQRFNDSELTVAMLFLACGPKMTVNEFPDKKYIAEVEDETTDIVFTIKSTNQCYRATMARLNMFTKNSSEPPEQMTIVFRDTAEIDRMIDLLQNVKKMAIGQIDGYELKKGSQDD